MQINAHGTRLLIALAATSAALLSAARSPNVEAEQPSPTRIVTDADTVAVRILGINDLHGHLEPQAQGGRRVGGVAHLATALDRSARGHHAIRVSAGDAVGASPLISGHFRDEPSIEALNAMRFDLATLGNHEFDRGVAEMRRLTRVAEYPYIAANVVDRATGEPLLRPYEIVERGGVRIGFIGVTTMGTTRWLLPEHGARLAVRDISDTVNRYAAELRERGVRAIAVLGHVGGAQQGTDGAVGEIVGETEQMTDEVDVVVAGHTHANMNVRIGRKLIVQAMSYGTAFGEIDLAVDRVSGEVVASDARVERTWSDALVPDARVEELVDRYRRRVAGLADLPAGELTEAATRVPRSDGVSPLGRLVADAQRAAAGADYAFVNADWIRANLPAGPLRYEDVYAAQPFGNRIVRMELSGREILDVLQRERTGFNLEWSGAPETADPERTYVVAVNEFLAGGGEGFEEFLRGRNVGDVGLDVEVLRRHLLAKSAGGPVRP